MKNILAISGSLRTGSSNHAILNYLKQKVSPEINYAIYNLLEHIPPFDPGKDNNEVAGAINDTRNLISDADGIIICTPEYAFGVPGALKNMLDWLVSSGSITNKPVMLITASLNGDYAHASLLLTLGALSANVIEDACFIIPFIRSKVSSNGIITDGDSEAKINKAFSIFLKEI